MILAVDTTSTPQTAASVTTTPTAAASITTAATQEDDVRPPSRQTHSAAPALPSRSAVLFPHLAALSARTPSLGKSALQAAAKPLILASLKATAGNGVGEPALGAGHGLARIGQPVVSLKAVVTTTAAAVATVASSKSAVVGASPARGSGLAAVDIKTDAGGASIKPTSIPTPSATSSISTSAGCRVTSLSPLLLQVPSVVSSQLAVTAATNAETVSSSLSPPITSAAVISTIVGTVLQESLDREQRRSQDKEVEEAARIKIDPGRECPVHYSLSNVPHSRCS